jgi:hypothetical protein
MSPYFYGLFPLSLVQDKFSGSVLDSIMPVTLPMGRALGPQNWLWKPGFKANPGV